MAELNTLLNLLMNQIYISPNQIPNKKNEIKEKYFDDDSENKRANRTFSRKQKDECWKKARKIPNRDPSRWRYDAVGNVVLNALKGCTGLFCHEYDHIKPYSKGGDTTIRNCQILQTTVNRKKSNRTDLSMKNLKGYSNTKSYSSK